MQNSHSVIAFNTFENGLQFVEICVGLNWFLLTYGYDSYNVVKLM